MWSAVSVAVCSIIVCSLVPDCFASNGDRTQFFQNCRANCERSNCSADGLEIQEQAIKYYQQSVLDKLFLWTCADECQYGCMWRTVDAFLERGWEVPQFYGKWPFVRFLGLQEPASVFFSVLNFVVHYKNLRKFRREVRPDSPCYKLWHVFAFTCLNGWIWSIVFHTRDFPLTELLDYAFAHSMILISLYCMLMRMIHKYSLFLRGLITLIFLSYFVNYFAYLSVGKFSYSLNMATNIVTGIFSGGGWILWSFLERNKRPYSKGVFRFYVLFVLSLSLELLDFSPALWTIDAHSLWHLATAVIISVFYSFIIDDCKMLRKEKMLLSDTFNKEI